MHSIRELPQKIKSFLVQAAETLKSYGQYIQLKEDLFIAILIFLVGLASFGLGKLSVYEASQTPITVSSANKNLPATALAPLVQGTIVASKTGTRYYYPSCSGASRIKDENKVWYMTEADAQAAGLTLGSGCAK